MYIFGMVVKCFERRRGDWEGVLGGFFSFIYCLFGLVFEVLEFFLCFNCFRS